MDMIIKKNNMKIGTVFDPWEINKFSENKM